MGMADASITADYLIMGAGATGMAFADSVLTDTDATMVIVDRHDRPGGHWNDAYPFVRLHQPSSFYGVNSAPLGSGRIDEVGLNAGFHELAAGQEVRQPLRPRDAPSVPAVGPGPLPADERGRRRPRRSRRSGGSTAARSTRVASSTRPIPRCRCPSTTPPGVRRRPEVACIPLNDVPRTCARPRPVRGDRRRQDRDGHVHLAARQRRRSRPHHMDHAAGLVGAEPQPTCNPATSSSPRSARASPIRSRRSARRRLGRRCLRPTGSVRRAPAHRSDRQAGGVPLRHPQRRRARAAAAHPQRRPPRPRATASTRTRSGSSRARFRPVRTRLHIDCSAAGIPTHPSTPIFDGDRITLQWVRTCQPAFSAALIGFVEASFSDDAVKNRICTARSCRRRFRSTGFACCASSWPTGPAGVSTRRSTAGSSKRGSTCSPRPPELGWAST